MEKIMKSAKTFYYVHNVRYSDTTHCFIRGLGIHEQMKKGFISHGGQGYPWLFMYFHTPVTLTPDTREEKKFDHGFILWDPEKFHVYGNAEKDWDHSWMILYHPEMERILQDFEIPRNRVLNIDAGRIFERYLALFYEELNSKDTPDPFLLEQEIRLFLYELNRIIEKKEPQIPERIREIEQYLSLHLEDPLFIPELAERFHLSAPHFIALFKRYYHCPPMHYIMEKRMNLAAYLLKHSSYSCKEIGRRCGYEDPLHFSKRFKCFHGTSPKTYREHAKFHVVKHEVQVRRLLHKAF